MGHSKRKPTTLGTNIKYLQQFEGLADRRPAGELQPVTNSLERRTSESRSWAAWPVDFKIEVSKGILLELEEYKFRGELDDGPPLAAKMTSDQWKQHVMNDHVPYSRECTTCLQGSGRSRPHKKIPHPDAQTLSVDICGPFRPGHDRMVKAKYFMVGVFAIPVRKVEGKTMALPLSLEETLGVTVEDEEPEVEELKPALQEEERAEPEKKEEDDKILEEWRRLEVEAEEIVIEIQNYTMVETLVSRNVAEVKACLAKMIARLIWGWT